MRPTSGQAGREVHASLHPGGWVALVAALLLACPRAPEPEPAVRGPTPGWAAAPEPAGLPGLHRETIHHETVHVRLLLPDGATVERGLGEHGVPEVSIVFDRFTLTCGAEDGIGAMGATLARTPPTVYGLPVVASRLGADGAAAWYVDALGDVRISGHAPGVRCSTRLPTGLVPREELERVFEVCASVRAPPAGPWRRPTADERARGGVALVPEGAFLRGSRLSTGEFVVSRGQCPASFDALRTPEPNEVDVQLTRQRRTDDEVWIRAATEEHDDVRYPGDTTVLVNRPAGCCFARIAPWTRPADPARLAYATALCDAVFER